MQLLDVYHPAIDVNVSYQVLDSNDVDDFIEAHRYSDIDEYAKAVIERVVYNLRTEVVRALRSIDKTEAKTVMKSIYNGCIMLNPTLDIDAWMKLSSSSTSIDEPKTNKKITNTKKAIMAPKKQDNAESEKKPEKKKISRAKFKGLAPFLKEKVIGQDEAVNTIVSALKRSIVGLSDDERPLGVFLFAGASGIGKTHLAKELHSYVFGDDSEFVRLDCGEYQHKHENQKLTGSPPGYVAYEEGGQLTEKIKKNPQTVLLLDEVEKAHPDVWDTFLRVFDEGMITDSHGEEVSFRDTIIIMTTNLGNQDSVDSLVTNGLGFGRQVDIDFRDAEMPERDQVVKYTDKAIRKSFRPEFLNRIDKIVVFNHLSKEAMVSIADLEMDKITSKLKKKGITLNYEASVAEKMIDDGVNPVEGVRGLSKIRREYIEDVISDALLSESRWPRGTVISLYVDEDEYKADIRRPKKKTKKQETDS